MNKYLIVFGLTSIVALSLFAPLACASGAVKKYETSPAFQFPLPETAYIAMEAEYASQTQKVPSLLERLKIRVVAHPFNAVATAIFFFAVAHTFLAGTFNRLAHRYEIEHQAKLQADKKIYMDGKDPVSVKASLFHFFGEIEAIFGIWLLPLFLAIVLMEPEGLLVAAQYFDSRNFTEPMFVVVVMAIAASRPVVQFAETCLRSVASLGKQSPAAWWLSILIVAPLLGSFITEPAAMTIAALLLGQQFYRFEPRSQFKYATLGLLFVNVSVGGTLTHFAAPPILMVANAWNWNLPMMFTQFGWRAIIGIVISTTIYYFIFRNDFNALEKQVHSQAAGEVPKMKAEMAPFWIVLIHLGFIAWTVLSLHHPPFFIGGFLLFLAFTSATHHHQHDLRLRTPIMVGFFLAGLVTHGGLQGWWISPILSALSEVPLFIGATILTAFNDNAAITYLASQVTAFSPEHLVADQWLSKTGTALTEAQGLEYAVVAGAVTGGGLTVIANAPNPAGQSILSKYFNHGVSPLKLLLSALLPTLIMACMFMLLPR